LLRPVDRDPESGNISRNAGSGHNLEMDRWGRDFLAIDCDGTGWRPEPVSLPVAMRCSTTFQTAICRY
jgi:hypothetical protein